MVDQAVCQRRCAIADLRAAVGNSTSGQTVVLQKFKGQQSGIVQAAASIVEDTEQGPYRQCVPRRTDAAMRAADRDATLVSQLKLGDGVNQPEHVPDQLCLSLLVGIHPSCFDDRAPLGNFSSHKLLVFSRLNALVSHHYSTQAFLLFDEVRVFQGYF